MKAAQVSASTAPLVTSSMIMSLRRMGWLRSGMVTAPPAQRASARTACPGRLACHHGWSLRNHSRAQQLRAQCQAGGLRGPRIDTQPHVLVDQHEANHAAALREVVEIAHGEYVAALEGVQDLRQVRRLRRADVENMATRRIADALQ